MDWHALPEYPARALRSRLRPPAAFIKQSCCFKCSMTVIFLLQSPVEIRRIFIEQCTTKCCFFILGRFRWTYVIPTLVPCSPLDSHIGFLNGEWSKCLVELAYGDRLNESALASTVLLEPRDEVRRHVPCRLLLDERHVESILSALH